jgi:hypothetical protein
LNFAAIKPQDFLQVLHMFNIEITRITVQNSERSIK